MSIRLNYGEDFNSGLKRLMVEECEIAIAALLKAETRLQQHEASHSSRKAFKKIRACLRLVRDEVDFYDEENKFFRDLGRKLSEVRDATSNLETLDLIEKQFENELYQNALGNCRKVLEKHQQKCAEITFDQHKELSKVATALQEKLNDVKNYSINIESFDQLRPSLKRVYKRGLKGYHQASETKKVSDLHEWRKRVKYLRYQIDILHPSWPTRMKAMEKELHNLSDYTGYLHDLEVMLNTLSEYGADKKYPEQWLMLHSLCKQLIVYMQKHSFYLGQRFYFNSPKRFTKIINNYWDAYKGSLNQKDLPQITAIEY